MSYLEQKELESTYMMSTYARKPVEFVRGEGMRLYDSEGREYLDFLSGIGAVCLGHANATVSEAIAAQAQNLIQASNYYYCPGRGELARDLSQLLNGDSEGGEDGSRDEANEGGEHSEHGRGGEGNKDSAGDAKSAPWKTFFANSGAEANEGAIKLARKYGKLYLKGAGTVLTARRSFHGRTLATTAATGQEVKQESFLPMPSGFTTIEPGDVDSFLLAHQAGVQAAREQGCPELAPAAVMLECIQGEGGVWPLGDEYLQVMRVLTEQFGLLLIIDEVQTGFYRTGLPFSFMHAGIRPDVVTMAKGIANGFPCAAFAATGKAAEVLVPGEHGSTFGGNSLAIAAARATLSQLTGSKLGPKVAQSGAYFRDALATLPHVTEVRGKGLMLAVSLDTDCATTLVDKALERGMVINAIGSSVLRFLPPLIVSKADIDTLMAVLRELLEAVE